MGYRHNVRMLASVLCRYPFGQSSHLYDLWTGWGVLHRALVLFLPWEWAMENELQAQQLEHQQQGGQAPPGGMDALGPTPAAK